MAQTPCPQPDLQLQSWGSSGVCLETEVCFSLYSSPPPPAPWLWGWSWSWGVPKQTGSPRLLLRATCASLVCSSHLATTPFPKSADHCLHPGV